MTSPAVSGRAWALYALMAVAIALGVIVLGVIVLGEALSAGLLIGFPLVPGS